MSIIWLALKAQEMPVGKCYRSQIMTTTKLQEEVKRAIEAATPTNKLTELTAEDIEKVQEAVDAKLEKAAEQAAK